MSSAVASWGTRESWRELPWISSKERDEAAVSQCRLCRTIQNSRLIKLAFYITYLCNFVTCTNS